MASHNPNRTMEKLRNMDAAVGRTVKGIGAPGDKVVIAFTDGSYLALEWRGFPDGSGYHEESDAETASELWEAGAITHEEFKRMREAERQRWEAENEARERLQFERLKKKFNA